LTYKTGIIKQLPTLLEIEGETDRVMIENFRIGVFRAVAQHLNFSRAAEELLLTQPAITQQIKALKMSSAYLDSIAGVDISH
jgi:hypothetical protein